MWLTPFASPAEPVAATATSCAAAGCVANTAMVISDKTNEPRSGAERNKLRTTVRVADVTGAKPNSCMESPCAAKAAASSNESPAVAGVDVRRRVGRVMAEGTAGMLSR